MRLIDADELNKAMFHGVAEIVPEDEHSPESYKRGWNDALEAVADKSCTPTIDAVPVVRCKDCKWWDADYRECCSPQWYLNQVGCVLQPAGMFCGWGEKKGDQISDGSEQI